MHPAHRLIPALALGLLSAASMATTTTYTTSASFLAQVAAGAYTETFTLASQPPVGPVSFSGGGYAYTVSAPGNLYASGSFLGTNLPDEALTITFTSGNVKAVGGNFYATNLSDAFQSVAMTLTLSDGTTTTFTPTAVASSFRGYVSTTSITSLVISSPGVSLYAGIDNLVVGTAVAVVPEPAAWALMSLGLAGLLVARRRAA